MFIIEKKIFNIDVKFYFRVNEDAIVKLCHLNIWLVTLADF